MLHIDMNFSMIVVYYQCIEYSKLEGPQEISREVGLMSKTNLGVRGGLQLKKVLVLIGQA